MCFMRFFTSDKYLYIYEKLSMYFNVHYARHYVLLDVDRLLYSIIV